MMDDPIVEEIRRIRRQLSEECGHDVRRFGEMIRERQRKSGREYIPPPERSRAKDAAK